jgi:hypothetical protein
MTASKRLVAAAVVAVGTIVGLTWWAAIRWSLSVFELAFFSPPVLFVCFLLWQATLYHVVSLGEQSEEWSAPGSSTAEPVRHPDENTDHRADATEDEPRLRR